MDTKLPIFTSDRLKSRHANVVVAATANDYGHGNLTSAQQLINDDDDDGKRVSLSDLLT